MKYAWLLLLTLALPCAAQQGNTLTFNATGAPTGTCGPTFFWVNASNGNLYNCKGGAWNLVSGGGGTPGGSDKQFQFNNAGSFGGSLGLTYDTTLLMPLMQVFQMSESTATSNPSSGNHWVYVDSTSKKLSCINSDASSCIATGTASNCAAAGTAANPSVVSCGSAAAGIVYCDVAASAGTCQINTTAAGTNSEILVVPSTADSTLLNKTCNASPSVVPAILLASKSNGVSFTLNMDTVAVNGMCFEYLIVNK